MIENDHVHKVYEQIAAHFSDTRHKQWPVVSDFLSQQLGLGLDVGCGNGKYLSSTSNALVLGCDYSPKLAHICQERGFHSLVADALSLPYRPVFDFCLSIAVVHHLSTAERRRKAIENMLRILKPGGRMLVYVWALEQTGKRQFTQQDVMVPWKLPNKYTHDSAQKELVETQVVYQRYYHMFVKGELDHLVASTGLARIVQVGYDRDNHYVIAERI